MVDRSPRSDTLVSPLGGPVGAEGDFQVNSLYDGTYAMCVELAESSLLDPLLWAAQPVTVKVATARVTLA